MFLIRKIGDQVKQLLALMENLLKEKNEIILKARYDDQSTCVYNVK